MRFTDRTALYISLFLVFGLVLASVGETRPRRCDLLAPGLVRLALKKITVAHPDIPTVYQVYLPDTLPNDVENLTAHLSPGLIDPLLAHARRLRVIDDFKILSDARPKGLSVGAMQVITAHAREVASRVSGDAHSNAYQRAYLEHLILESYLLWDTELSPVTYRRRAFDAQIRSYWAIQGAPSEVTAAFRRLETQVYIWLRRTPPTSFGSLLPSPYPGLISSPRRFSEFYYWDSYFGLQYLLKTHRTEMAKGIVENFLHAIQVYGLIPNGMRDYYLSRSQLPFISSMVREVYDGSPRARAWLAQRAYPLVKRDYEQFWMNPQTRFDPATGLNHHWDDLNVPRPERHSADQESRLGHTYRDVRAAAESGEDFQSALIGETTRIAPVLLNALLYKTEMDLSKMASELGLTREADQFLLVAERRRQAMQRHLWNAKLGQYENFNLRTRQRIPILTADSFAPLFVGMVKPAQAERIRQRLSVLETPFGIMASETTDSPYQWDAPHGWAPHQWMTIQGLKRYGFEADARQLATHWTNLIAQTAITHETFFERMDVVAGAVPAPDRLKYPAQCDFMWTGAVFGALLVDVLGYPLVEP